MKKLILEKDLTSLKHAARDEFGPKSARPYIAIDLSDAKISHGGWLSELPCPVVGIGDGPLSSACDILLNDAQKLPIIDKNIRKAPLAAMILVQHLRTSETQSVINALTAESFAYAAVQNGPEFQAWLKGYDRPNSSTLCVAPLLIDRDDGTLSIILNQAKNQNAIGIDMRDALCEALDLALMDDSLTQISLTGSGKVFSTGGDINEFGEVPDPATAHWGRSLRLPAWRLARLSERLHVHVNGAAIGAGVEIAAFGSHVTTSSKAWFQLPELKYGLIPGAGGTVSLPRRIGRQRTAYMALTMDRIRVETALNWGLIDAVID